MADGQMTQSTYLEIDACPARITEEETARAAADTKLTNGLAELIDSGAKNVLNWNESSGSISGVTFTVNTDKTVTTANTATARAQKPLNFAVPSSLPTGRYILTGCPAGGAVGATVKYCLYAYDQTANARVSQNDTGEGIEFDWTPDSTHAYNVAIDIRSGTNANGLTFKPMICLKSAYDISNRFVPYVPSNAELWDMIQNGTRSVQDTRGENSVDESLPDER